MPLQLDFKKGSNFTSIALYGKNGTGKSSIADSWEWLQSGKISHLTRENSGEKDYPHKYTGDGQCYISAEFEGTINGVVSSTFDKKKITIPIIDGDYEIFKENAKHPCYLRYRELQQFVYNSKAEKYSYLAKYLGFEKQLKFQTDLFAYYKQLNDLYYSIKGDFDEKTRQISFLVEDQVVNNDTVLAAVKNICLKYNLDEPKNILELKMPSEQLHLLIDSNPINSELNQWIEFRKKLIIFNSLSNIIDLIKSLNQAFIKLKTDEDAISKIVLSDLYSSAISVLDNNDFSGHCPVCDNRVAICC